MYLSFSRYPSFLPRIPSPRAKSIATEGFSVRINVFNKTPIRIVKVLSDRFAVDCYLDFYSVNDSADSFNNSGVCGRA
jgi:hypothetical protein